MRRTLYIALLVLSLVRVAEPVAARTIRVTKASAINNTTFSPGDTVVMAAGVWTNQSVSLRGNGTASAPVVLMASTPGQVQMRGNSTLTLNGKYQVVTGLDFNGTYTGSSHIITFATGSEHCTLAHCRIQDYSTSSLSTDNKWVSLRGKEHTVTHCSFSGKANMGTLLVVWLESGIVPRHTISYNDFGYRQSLVDSDGKALNGQEIIRIGDSSTSMQDASCLVENNIFTDCDGEIETISNKSCSNTYRYNVFRHSAGSITLRHGNGCLVEHNYFFGEGKAATGGVRIIGENHTVIHNYFHSLTGNNFRAAICVVTGRQNSELNGYFQVKNAVIAHNTCVNCKEAVCLNYNTSSDCTLPPLSSRLDSNIVYNDASNKSNIIVNIAAAGGSLTQFGNTYNAGKWKNYSPATSAWTKQTALPLPVFDDENLLAVEDVGPDWLRPDLSTSLSLNPLFSTGEEAVERLLWLNGMIVLQHDGQLYNLNGSRIQ